MSPERILRVAEILREEAGVVRVERVAEMLALAQELEELASDTARLDFLDRMNVSLNRHHGTEYGWKLILSPNVVRLMRDHTAANYLTDIDLHDSEPMRTARLSCRAAIDDVMAAMADPPDRLARAQFGEP